MRLFNTLTRTLEEFEPSNPDRVGIYVCGPTVYDVPHVGHARAAVAFDVLRRHLSWRGHNVLFVRNVTDIDDKIIAKAEQTGRDFAAVAEEFTRVYDDAMSALNVLPPDIAPRATGHIIEMIAMIETLIAAGHAYVGGDTVWFDVASDPNYGHLSNRSLDDMRAGERVEAHDGKKNPLDFALWKGAKEGEPYWESPWGRGRPGWHIECSAMANRYLGVPFDIHGGGADLIFPHHENEIAQAQCALEVEPFARYWLHNGHVQIDGEKMSKSLRNYVMVTDVLEDYPPQVLRLFLVSAQYRSQINYSPDSLEEAKAVWDRFSAFLRSGPADAEPDESVLKAFGEAMDDDLNTALAISVLHGAVSDGNREPARAPSLRAAVAEAFGVLGLESASESTGRPDVVDGLVRLALAQRDQARANKDWATSDAIRDALFKLGVVVEDSADGARWHLT